MSDRLLRRREVEEEVGLSRAAIYRRIAEGTFPRPKQLSARCVRWPESEIRAWKDRQPRTPARH